MCSKVSVSQSNFKDNLSQNCKHSLLDTLAQLSTDTLSIMVESSIDVSVELEHEANAVIVTIPNTINNFFIVSV